MSDRRLTAAARLTGAVQVELPPVEAVDTLAPDALPAFIATCAALQARAASRLLDRAVPAPRAEETEQLLTVPEAAARLGFAPSYAYELVRRGALASVRRGRYVRLRPAAITAFIAAHEHGALDSEISDTLSTTRDRRGSAADPPTAPTHAGRTRGTTRRSRDHNLEMGNQRTQGSRAGGEAVATPRQDGTR